MMVICICNTLPKQSNKHLQAAAKWCFIMNTLQQLLHGSNMQTHGGGASRSIKGFSVLLKDTHGGAGNKPKLPSGVKHLGGELETAIL